MIVTVTLNPAFDKALTVQSLRPGALNRVTLGPVVPSGKGINVALVASAWGVPTHALALAGEGRERLAAFLDQRGVEHKLIPVSGEIRTNIKLFAQDTGQMTEINELGPTIGSDDLCRLEHELLALREVDLVVLSGSLPPGVPPDLYARLASLLAVRGIRVVMDASGPALRCALKAPLYAMKPNRSEAEELVGDEVASLGGQSRERELLNALRKTNTPHVILTLGADGALFAAENRVLSVKPPPIQAGNAAGAGDALLATYLVGIVNNWPLEQRVARATAAGAAAAQGLGTDLARPADVYALERQVSISE